MVVEGFWFWRLFFEFVLNFICGGLFYYVSLQSVSSDFWLVDLVFRRGFWFCFLCVAFSGKKVQINFGVIKKVSTFAVPNETRLFRAV